MKFSRFLFNGFKESHAWLTFFREIYSVLVETNSLFETKFCTEPFLENGKPVLTPDGNYKYNAKFDGSTGYFQTLKDEKGVFIICISSEKELQFEGCDLSTDKSLWKQRETPLRGVLYARPKEGQTETWIIGESSLSLDLEKCSSELDSVLMNGQKNPSLFFYKKKSSTALIKEELERHNIDYTVEYSGSNDYNYLIKDAVEILKDGFFISRVPLYPEDKLFKEKESFEVGEHSKDQLAGVKVEGFYSVKRRNIRFSPKTNSKITNLLIDIAANSRETKSNREVVETLFLRESPLRLSWSVIYVTKRLNALPRVRANLTIDRTEGFKSTSIEGNYSQEFYIGWKKGSELQFYLYTKNVKEWSLSSIEDIDGKKSERLSVRPISSNSYKTLITVENTEYNREFKKIRYTLRFKSSTEKSNYRVDVIVTEWNPVTEERNMKDLAELSDLLSKQGYVIKERTFVEEQLERKENFIEEGILLEGINLKEQTDLNKDKLYLNEEQNNSSDRLSESIHLEENNNLNEE